jgi:hypothetical protein
MASTDIENRPESLRRSRRKSSNTIGPILHEGATIYRRPMLPSAAQQLTRSAPPSKAKGKAKTKTGQDVVARKIKATNNTRLQLTNNDAEGPQRETTTQMDPGIFTPSGSADILHASANTNNALETDGNVRSPSGLISPPPEETLRQQEQNVRSVSFQLCSDHSLLLRQSNPCKVSPECCTR